MKLLLLFFAAFVIYSFMATRWYRAERWYKYVGLYLYIGLPGSGKTYALIYHTVRSLASGRHVMTNFRLRHDRVVLALQSCYGLSYSEAKERLKLHSYVETFADLVSAVETDVYLDEVQDMLRSADWDIMPVEVITWFAQHRHHKCRIKMSTHKLGAVHNYIRALVSNVYLAGQPNFFIKLFRTVTGTGKLPLLAYQMVKDARDDLIDNPKRKKGRAAIMSAVTGASYMTLDPRIANCYDTHGGVLPSPMDVIRAETGKGAKRFELPARVFNPLISRPADGLPCITHDELVACISEDVKPHELLSKRFSGVLVVPEPVSEPVLPAESEQVQLDTWGSSAW